MRFFVIADDGETISRVLTMDLDDALANTGSGETLIAIDPETDNGGTFLHETVKADLTGATPVFIDVATDEPVEDHPVLTDTELEIVS